MYLYLSQLTPDLPRHLDNFCLMLLCTLHCCTVGTHCVLPWRVWWIRIQPVAALEYLVLPVLQLSCCAVLCRSWAATKLRWHPTDNKGLWGNPLNVCCMNLQTVKVFSRTMCCVHIVDITPENTGQQNGLDLKTSSEGQNKRQHAPKRTSPLPKPMPN